MNENKSAWEGVFDAMRPDLDPDIQAAFDKKYLERVGPGQMQELQALQYFHEPHLIAAIWQLIRELKKIK